MRDRLRVVIPGLVDEAGPLPGELVAPEAQRRGALAADDRPDDLAPFGALLPLELERPAQYLPVERPGEAAVARDHEKRDALHLTALHQCEVAERGRGARRADHQLLHPVGVRPHLLDPRLCPAQPGARDELEGPRDLARVLDRRDAPADVLQRRH